MRIHSENIRQEKLCSGDRQVFITDDAGSFISTLFTLENKEAKRAATLRDSTDSQLRLQFGEMTAQEIRTMRAALNYITGGK